MGSIIRIAISLMLTILFIERNTAQTSTMATAGIVVAINVTAGNTLHFGDIAPHHSYGDVIRINLSGTNRVSVLGYAQLLPSDDGHPGTVTATGTINKTFQITLPGNYEVYLARVGGGGVNMRVENFTSLPSITGTFDATGQRIISLGGQLVVGANQLAGFYTGTFNVTIQYQ